MKKLIFLGNGSDENIVEHILGYLNQKISFQFYQKDILQSYGNCPSLEIFHLNQIKILDLEETLLFLKSKADLRLVQYVNPKTIMIINSAKEQQLKYAARLQAQVITIGLSHKDTITFSSKGEYEWVVSLQRAIRALDGSIIEPMEIPCYFDRSYSDDYILGFVAILLLLKQIGEGESLNLLK